MLVLLVAEIYFPYHTMPFGTYFKLLLAWASIIMLDFFTDLRFEFIWSCWLMVRTVNDSFRYQGLAFALFFTLTAIMADLLCYFLVPTTLIYLLGSSCVWMHLLWQTDRGVYIPTVALCFLFFYVEVAVRFRDPKSQPLGIDLCRPFAAHCIGYPVVTLGFSLKSMISHHFRLRRQKLVEAQNITFFSILEEALPKELWCYLKSDTIPKSKHSNMVCENNCSTLAISSPTSTVPNLTSSGHIPELNRVNTIHSRDKDNHSASSVNKKNMSLNHPRTTRIVYSSTRGDNCSDLSLCSNDNGVSQECTFRLGNDEPVNNHTSVPSTPSEQPESYVAVSLAQTILVKVPSIPNSVVPDTVSADNHIVNCIKRDIDMKEDKLIHKKSTSLLASVTSGLSTSTCSNSTNNNNNNNNNNNRAKSNCTSSNSKSCETKQTPPSMNITSNKTTFSNNSNVSSASSGAAGNCKSSGGKKC
uniref:Macoilin n=2 Tax=Schistosoma mansoni TaxID=6183 RepID=A0A5K4FE10_SCHMA